MTKEAGSTIETLKNYLKSQGSNTLSFNTLWNEYPQKKRYISELVALACERNRLEALKHLLDDVSLHDSLKDVPTSNNKKSLFPIVHAFYYGQPTCVKYLLEKHPLLLIQFTTEELVAYTKEGLNYHQRPGSLFQWATAAGDRTKEARFKEIFKQLDHETTAMPHMEPNQTPISLVPTEEKLPMPPEVSGTHEPRHALINTHVTLGDEELKTETHARIETPRIIRFTELLTAINQGERQTFNTAFTALTEKKMTLKAEENALAYLANAFLATWKLGKWVIKDKGRIQCIHMNRDAVLQDKSSANLDKLEMIEELFNFIDEKLFTKLSKGCDHLNPNMVESWYVNIINQKGTHFSHDASDDSDSEDEARTCSLDKKRQYEEMAALHNNAFWQKTQRNVLSKQKKFQLSQGTHTLKLKESLKRKLKDRAELPEADPSKPIFVPAFRGNNYLEDRWSYAQKRQHYRLDEVGQPQYSESAMMAVSNFYQEEKSFSPVKRLKMDKTALSIQNSHHRLNETGPCLALTKKPGQELFIFNSFGDYLQHHYSNGISDHLKQLVGMLKAKDEWLSQAFANAYNYAISASDRPYHSLRYALGLKDYYHHPFTPRYNRDGSIQNVHAGKLYIFLFTVKDMQDPQLVNRVNSMLQKGKCPVLRDISSEVETTLFGKVNAEHVVYQFPLRFPSFNKEYKAIFLTKYGMDEELYKLFQSLLKNSPFEYTSEGKAKNDEVIDLLKEWLCAYYEVMALEMARRIANKKGGDLLYFNENDTLSSMPPQRPLVNGKENLPARRKMHILEETRRYLANKLKTRLMDDSTVVFMKIDLKAEVQKLLLSPNELFEIAYKVYHNKLQLTASEEEEVNRKCAQPAVRRDEVLNELYTSVVKDILTANIDTFVSSEAKASQRMGLFSWETPHTSEFQNAEAMSAHYCNNGPD